MASKETVYQPLERSSIDLRDDALQYYSTRSGRQCWERPILILCFLAIVISNGVWLGLYKNQNRVQGRVQAGIGFPIRVPYEFSTPYVDGNLTMTNPLWKDLFPQQERSAGRGAIKVDHKWAAENNLPPTQGNASDGKAIYFVAAFHHLHCLNVLRTSLFQFNNGHKQKDDWSHVVHCIDAIRQQIQCLADPALGGVSVDHECRDFNALKEWTVEHAYTDYLEDDSELEL